MLERAGPLCCTLACPTCVCARLTYIHTQCYTMIEPSHACKKNCMWCNCALVPACAWVHDAFVCVCMRTHVCVCIQDNPATLSTYVRVLEHSLREADAKEAALKRAVAEGQWLEEQTRRLLAASRDEQIAMRVSLVLVFIVCARARACVCVCVCMYVCVRPLHARCVCCIPHLLVHCSAHVPQCMCLVPLHVVPAAESVVWGGMSVCAEIPGTASTSGPGIGVHSSVRFKRSGTTCVRRLAQYIMRYCLLQALDAHLFLCQL